MAVLARPSWIAVVAKKGTPPEFIKALNEATNQCYTDPVYANSMDKMGVTLMRSQPADVLGFAERDIAVWKPLIDKLGLATQ